MPATTGRTAHPRPAPLPARGWVLRAPALVLAVLAFGLVVATATPAAAHAALVSASPGSGTVLDDAPDEVELTFNEAIEVGLGGVRLYDAEGARVDLGSPTVDGTTVRAPAGDLADGSYVLTYRVTSADGHPIQGAWVFSIGAATAGADAEGLAERLLSSQGAPTSVGIAYALVRLLVFVGLVTAVGAAALAAWAWPGGARSRRLARLVAGAWALAALAGVLGIGVHAAWAAGHGLGRAADLGLWRDLLETRAGRWWGIRAVVLLAGLPLVLSWARGTRPVRATVGAGAALAGAALLATSLAGHAATGERVALSVPADVVHLAAVAAWIGGLVALWTVVLREPLDEAEPAVRRFSSGAPWLVGVVVATGVVRSWEEVGSLGALRDTDYGRLLVAKVVLVGVLVVVASVSRELVGRGLRPEPVDEVGEPLPVGPGAHRVDATPEAARRLRGAVGVEIGLAVAVLVVTSLLVTTHPASSQMGDDAFLTVVEGDEIALDVQVVPSDGAYHEVHLQALDPGGTLTDVLDMTASFSAPSREIVGLDVPLRRLGAGHYFSPGVELPLAGTWTLEVVVATGPVTDESFEVDVPVD